MSGSKSKSPPQRKAKTTGRKRTRPTISAARAKEILARHGVEFIPNAKHLAADAQAPADTGLRTLDEVSKLKGTPIERAQDYSVNALSKLLGKDRRTIDKALVDVAPTRTEGKTKFYRLADVEQALRDRCNGAAQLKDEKLIEEIRKLRTANDFEDGKLVLRSAVCESLRRCLSPMVATLEQKFVNELPTAAAGLDVPQLRIVAKRYLDDALVSCQELAKEWN